MEKTSLLSVILHGGQFLTKKNIYYALLNNLLNKAQAQKVFP